jgi:hypothetical protein
VLLNLKLEFHCVVVHHLLENFPEKMRRYNTSTALYQMDHLLKKCSQLHSLGGRYTDRIVRQFILLSAAEGMKSA